MWMTHPLDDILSSAAKVAVLRVLADSGVPVTGREVGRRAGVAPGHVSRVLRELLGAGVLDARVYGRTMAYALKAEDHPLVAELRRLFGAEADRSQAVRRTLCSLVPEDLEEGEREVLSVVLFGSEARGKAKAGSDTDVLFIVRRRDPDLERRIADLCDRLYREYRAPVEPLVTDLAEVREWKESGNPFWKNVQAEGLRLAGTRLEDLKRLWQPGMPATKKRANTGVGRRPKQPPVAAGPPSPSPSKR